MIELSPLSGVEADDNPHLAEQLAAWQEDQDQQPTAVAAPARRRPSATGTLGSLLINSSAGDYYDF